jgi:anti-sigma B factor antagonist
MIDKQNKNISSLEAKLSNIQSKGLTLQKDEILYKYNDISDSIFLVLNGLIGLKNENEKNDFIKIKIKKDEFFGLEDVLQNIRRPHTAIALERSELLKIELMNISKQQINLLFNDLTKTRKTNNLLSSLTKTKDSNNLFGIQEVRGKKVVFFYGQHCNLTNAVLFKDYLFKYIDDGNKDLIINLLACKTIDSTFLGSLVASLKKTTSCGGDMKLVCNSDINSWLFVVTKMNKVFNIYGTLEEAVNN